MINIATQYKTKYTVLSILLTMPLFIISTFVASYRKPYKGLAV